MDVADEARFCLRKLMVMFYYERAGFKREFLEINGIHIHGLKHSVRASPRNERFWGVQRSGHGAIYRRKSGAVERQNLQATARGVFSNITLYEPNCLGSGRAPCKIFHPRP